MYSVLTGVDVSKIMKNLLNKIKTISTYRWLLLASGGGVLLLVLTLANRGPEPMKPKTPPVATTNPEIKLVSIEPAPGARQSIDGFTFTAFEFSATVNPDLVTVRADPYIALKKSVFFDRPNTLYIEPQTKAWESGITYTLTIVKGVIGINSEELKEDVVYTFSNTPPEYIDLPGPI